MIEFRTSRRSDLSELRRLWKEAFGDEDEYLDIFFRTAYSPERSRVLFLNGEVIGSAYWLDCFLREKKLAYIYAVAIDSHYQGQGMGSALMENIHRHLTASGYAGALLVPGDEGLRRYYSRFGYRTASFRRECSPKPGKQISAQRYALLRRNCLPENGVIQEGENLALLDELALFFEGEGYICAVSRQEIQCLELLDGADPGGETPYAMAKSLSAAFLPDNIYFGFGFD